MIASPAADVTPQAVPLSYAQERLWCVHQLHDAESADYNVSRASRIRGPLHVQALVRAIEALVGRHEALRTVFVEGDDAAVQIVKSGIDSVVRVDDLRDRSAHERAAMVADALRVEATTPFDFSAAPPFRARLLRLGDDEHVLIVTVHHIVFDGWSQQILNCELRILYQAMRDGEADPLPPLEIQYPDFAWWQRAEADTNARTRALGYWIAQLAGMPECTGLSTDGARAMADSTADLCTIVLPEELWQRVHALSRSMRLTPFVILLAAFGWLLSRHSEADDVIVGTPFAEREDRQLEDVIGLFVNVLPIRIRTSRHMTVRTLLEEVRDSVFDAMTFRDVPFERLIEALQPARLPNTNPLFQVLFTVHEPQSAPLSLDGVDVEPISPDRVVVPFDLEVHVVGRVVTWRYRQGLFNRWRIQQMAEHYANVLDTCTRDPEQRIVCVSPLSAEEQLAAVTSSDEAVLPARAGFPWQFEQCVQASPDSVAFVWKDHSLSFDELNARADHVAATLRRMGVGTDQVVSVVLPPSLDSAIWILGIVKIGAAYVPLDLRYPAARLLAMSREAGACWVVTTAALRDQLEGTPALVVLADVSQAIECLAHRSDDDGACAARSISPLNGAQTAYVTCGPAAAGESLAVVAVHDALDTRIQWWKNTCGAVDGPVLATGSSRGIDAVTACMAPLSVGWTVVIAAADEAYDAVALRRLVARQGVGAVIAAPRAIRAMVSGGPSDDLSSCTTWISSGGELRARDTVDLHQAVPHARLLNLYAPAELSGGALSAACPPGEAGLGTPLWNTRAYVLDAHLAPMPAGATGELYVGGRGLARGYLGRPGATASRFVADPFGPAGSRMFRTGDRARRWPDGQFAFEGRRHQQVVIGGARVDLREVEAALRALEGIAEAAVVVADHDDGAPALAGYVVAARGAAVDGEAIVRRLREELPRHMLPATVTVLPAMPLTPVGQLDRRALPRPSWRRVDTVPPRSAREALLCHVFSEVLRVEHVGIDDDFFSLGGHSLLATRVVNRINKALGLSLRISSVFDAPTVRELAERCTTTA